MTVVLRKNFYTIYTFLVQRLECHFCRYPLYQITSFRKKGQFSDSRIRDASSETPSFFAALIFTIRIFLG